jgi:alpha-D-ribose 1-methylphosphonate 5-triphosphate synthase subunit PhnH
MVHDLQSVYRKMIYSTSRPGHLSNIENESALIEFENQTGLSDSLLLIALTLLDPEVSFKVYSAHESDVTNKINQLTYAKAVEADQADYVFVLQDAELVSLEEAIQKGKPGTLKNPHQSATIIAEVELITNSDTYVLQGPGIQTTNNIHVEVLGNWVDSRQEKNIEFPLGIDLIFIDKNNQLLSLPRTTQITKNRVIF